MADPARQRLKTKRSNGEHVQPGRLRKLNACDVMRRSQARVREI